MSTQVRCQGREEEEEEEASLDTTRRTRTQPAWQKPQGTALSHRERGRRTVHLGSMPSSVPPPPPPMFGALRIFSLSPSFALSLPTHRRRFPRRLYPPPPALSTAPRILVGRSSEARMPHRDDRENEWGPRAFRSRRRRRKGGRNKRKGAKGRGTRTILSRELISPGGTRDYPSY